MKNRGRNAMSKKTTAFDQADEEVLTFDASDEALEAAAAAAPAKTGAMSFSFCTSPYICPWR
jgi:hypothetical protein